MCHLSLRDYEYTLHHFHTNSSGTYFYFKLLSTCIFFIACIYLWDAKQFLEHNLKCLYRIRACGQSFGIIETSQYEIYTTNMFEVLLRSQCFFNGLILIKALSIGVFSYTIPPSQCSTRPETRPKVLKTW